MEDYLKKESILDILQELAIRLRIIVILIVIVMLLVAVLPGSLFPFSEYKNVNKSLQTNNYYNCAYNNSSTNIENYSNFEGIYTTFISALLRKIEHDLLPSNVSIIAQSWTNLIGTYFMLALAIAIIICFPLIIYEIYKFIEPAMYKHEKKSAIKLIIIASFLFLFGATLAYILILPITFKIFMIFVYMTGAMPLISLDNFIFLVIALTLGTGLVFVSPLIMYFLITAEIINIETIESRRKYFYAAIIILVMILTPDPTLVTDIIILLPLIVLLEISLYLAKISIKHKKM